MTGPEAERYAGQESAALSMLRQTAIALGPELCRQIVFIGGAIAPVLQTDPALPKVRPTKDVDAIAAAASYTDMEALQDALRTAGFTQSGILAAERERFHAHRWTTPHGGAFDLVPAGSFLGGTGSAVDRFVLNTSWALDIARFDSDPVVIRHASPVAFLALKWAAYNDRGRDDPRTSHDLEDIIALIASRSTITEEAAEAPAHIKALLDSGIRDILDNPDTDELVDGHLGLSGSEAERVRRTVSTRLRAILTTSEASR